jgi:lipid-binding SYLF domain-containing protein
VGFALQIMGVRIYQKGETMKQTFIITFILLPFIAAGCNTTPKSPDSKAVLSAQVKEAVDLFKQKDPSIDRFFTQSYGYAVFPKIFKAGFWVGGAGGRGEVFEQSMLVGYSSVGQATLGLSFGGEFYREIVFFRDKVDLDKFKVEEYTFNAQATGIAITAGVAAKADYKAGLAVFIMADKGLMVDASVGGQKFSYRPLSNP